MKRHIILNRIQTPDGTMLTSRSVHDYVSHKDKNGEIYTNDGGNEYFHRTMNKTTAKDVSLYTDSPYKDIRENFQRFNVRTEKWVTLKDIEEEWLDDIIEYYKECESSLNLWLYNKEKTYRKSKVKK